MNRQTNIQSEFVELIPERLEPGKLYISHRYSTAVHLCCCGCGREVVTPLNPAKWRFTESRGTVSLFPSIGNWSFPCKSHYWITDSHIHWASTMSSALIAAVQNRDKQDAENYIRSIKPSSTGRSKIGEWWAKIIHRLRDWRVR
jgi:hypothetical protein